MAFTLASLARSGPSLMATGYSWKKSRSFEFQDRAEFVSGRKRAAGSTGLPSPSAGGALHYRFSASPV
jgi:hypothetical protein